MPALRTRSRAGCFIADFCRAEQARWRRAHLFRPHLKGARYTVLARDRYWARIPAWNSCPPSPLSARA